MFAICVVDVPNTAVSTVGVPDKYKLLTILSLVTAKSLIFAVVINESCNSSVDIFFIPAIPVAPKYTNPVFKLLNVNESTLILYQVPIIFFLKNVGVSGICCILLYILYI